MCMVEIQMRYVQFIYQKHVMLELLVLLLAVELDAFAESFVLRLQLALERAQYLRQVFVVQMKWCYLEEFVVHF